MEGKPWCAPQAQDNVHDLLKALRARVVRHLKVVILVDHLAAAHAEVQSSITQHVQHGGLFSHEDRVVEVEDADPGANANFAGAGGYVGGKGQGRGHDAKARKVMLCQPDRVEAQLLGVLNLLHCLMEDATLVQSLRLRPGGEDEQAKFHRLGSFVSSASCALVSGDCPGNCFTLS